MKKSDSTRIVIAAAITTIALIAMAVIIVVALWNVSSRLLEDGQTTTTKTPTVEETLIAEVDDCLRQVSDLRTQIADNQARVEALIPEEQRDSETIWWITRPLTGVGTDLQLAGECLEAMGEELKAERERNLADGMSPEERISTLRTGISDLKDDITKYEKAATEYLVLIGEVESILVQASTPLPELPPREMPSA